MIEVVATDAKEPFHVRVTNDGSDILVVGENLHNLEDAFGQIEAVAEQFGMGGATIRGNLDGDATLYSVTGGFLANITFKDERTQSDD